MIIGLSLSLLAWIATYAMHSVLWLIPGIWFVRRSTIAARTRATVLLVCIVAPFATTAISQLGKPNAGLALPGLRIEEDHRVERTIDGAGNVKTETTGGLTLASRITLLSISGLAATFVVIALARSALMMRTRRRAIREFGERTPVVSRAWEAAFDKVVHDFALSSPPRFSVADGLASPVALSGEVCIPRAWIDRGDVEEMRVVLAHEMEHVVWRDPAVLAALQFIRRAFPWQPLLSLALVSYLDAAEEACDAAAIRSTGDAKSVAHVLLRLGSVKVPTVAFTSLHSGRGIRQRIERIVATPAVMTPTMRQSRVIGISLVAALVVLTAVVPHVSAPDRTQAPDVDVRIEVTGRR